jgi:hypothetical protein
MKIEKLISELQKLQHKFPGFEVKIGKTVTYEISEVTSDSYVEHIDISHICEQPHNEPKVIEIMGY